MIRRLTTRDAILEKEELKKYLEKFSSDNVVKSKSKLNTYPIPSLKENCNYIYLVYCLLNDHVKMNLSIHPAGYWILDNYYEIEKASKVIEKSLSKKKYRNLPGLIDNGFARIYYLANEIVSNTDGKIDENDLKEYIEAYQTRQSLTMEEIWNIGIFLEICIIEKIKRICEKIFIAQIQKYKVENIVQRLIENKSAKQIKVNIEGKYPFIEYMEFKLKQYGKISTPYLTAFEEQLKKSGISLEDAINREHFDIAVKTLSMKNSIKSIKRISRINISNIFNSVNKVEEILKKDPSNVYEKMDYKTKAYYRENLLEIAKKTKLSEIFIANMLIDICKKEMKNKEKIKGKDLNKESHVGYYLIDEGKKLLIKKLSNRKMIFLSEKQKSKLYIFSIYFFSILITFILVKKLGILTLMLFASVQNAVTQIIQYLLSKTVKAKLIPKIEYNTKIPKESSTMCVMPVVLKCKEDVEKILKKLEVYYLANKSENIYFALLGDCTSGKNKIEKKDKEIIKEGLRITQELNEKYGKLFFFLYRKREWSNSERCYMGWERKRGILNQLNEYLVTGKSNFEINTIDIKNKIKYVITIDSDTNLCLNSAFELIGAMDHILNKPEIDKIKNIVIRGHGIIQPRIGLEITSVNKTIFSRLFAGSGGIDLYSNAISDIYQDNFSEGIYTGKGIYNVDTFYTVLKDSIPENKILSHDLLEGCYLRCGLASDIILLDDYPSNYNSYKVRKHRWIRGDIQILPWLRSDLNLLSKYKIVDNLIRNLNEAGLFFTILIAIITNKIGIIAICMAILGIPMIIKIIDNLINYNLRNARTKLFASNFSKWKRPIYKYLIDLATLPDIAMLETDAIIKSLYRMKISHNFLLEWTTAQEAESQKNTSIMSYAKSMIFQIIIAVIIIVLLKSTIGLVFGMLWISAIFIMWKLKEGKKDKITINQKEQEYLSEIAIKTWKFFKDATINGLPSDNYQEDRNIKLTPRTSSTNIGFFLLAIISSSDLGFETKENAIKMIKETIEQVEKLDKWNGHLYNWYDLNTLKPLLPKDISSVDSGNFIGYLYTTKQFLIENAKKYEDKKKRKEIFEIVKQIDNLIQNTDFSKLYNQDNGLFSIGFNNDENKLYDSYYDLLASEARQTSLIAIAKKDVPQKHWENLGRTLTKIGKYKGLVSWGGTAFEYLMPNINIPTYPATLIDESCKLLVQASKEYGKRLNIPWGISESAYNSKDFKGNYQYKTFGLPWLGLKRGLSDDAVVSPYSSALALFICKEDAIKNLKRLEKEGALGEYGFYESIDYKPKKEIIRTYMAHHQGMILASINNLVNDNILQKRFMNNPEIKGVQTLLEEAMPEDIMINRNKENNLKKIKYKSYEEEHIRNYGVNVICSHGLSNMQTDNGKGFTKFDDILINEGTDIYVKNIGNNKIYKINDEKAKVEFTSYESKLIKEDGNLKISLETTIAANCPVEVKKINIINKGIQEVDLEISSYQEPILSTKEQHYSHPAFNNMFLEYKNEGKVVFIKRKTRSEREKQTFMATTMYSEDGKIEFEIDKENLMTRNNHGIPESIHNSIPFSQKIKTVIFPVMAFRNIIRINPNESKNVYLITSVGFSEKQAKENLKAYSNNENLKRVFELSKNQTMAQMRYMGIKEKNIKYYQKIIQYLTNSAQKRIKLGIDISNKKLWKYGISGDFPIIVLNLKNINDYYVVKEILNVYEYLRSKNIKIEIAIITNIDIHQNIINDKMGQYLNKREGIFLINNIEREERKIIQERAKIIFDSSLGSIKTQIEELKKQEDNNEIKIDQRDVCKEENKIKEKAEVQKEKEEKKAIKEIKNIDFKNGIGEFNEKGDEYWINQKDGETTPLTWSNIMANEKFGTIITNDISGFTWYLNSKTNPITAFENNAYNGSGKEKILIKNEQTGNVENKWNDYFCYGFGYSKIFSSNNNIESEITVFVPEKDSAKISIIKIKNISGEKIKFKICYDIEWQMSENKKDRYIVEEYKENLNMVLVKNAANSWYYSYITSSEKINKEKEIIMEIEAGETKEFSIILGCEETEMQCINVGTKYTNNYNKLLQKTKDYWKKITTRVVAETPMKSFNIMQNGWLVYQTMVSRLYGKTGFYQISGGFGYRDQLQDAIGMKWINPDILKKQILLHAKHQFYEGDVEHWWHEDSNLGIRTRYSDDMLWLVFAVEEYVDFTGDYSLLNEKVKYIKAKELKEDEIDKVDIYDKYEKAESIFEHCIKALNKAMEFGENDLPLIKGGDWNDGMNKVGIKGKGESVWLGFFLYFVLNRFINIIDHEKIFFNKTFITKDMSIALDGGKMLPSNGQEINENEIEEFKEKIIKTIGKLKKALNTTGWDGRWYRRAFDDNGNLLGSIENDECKIDSITQSWAVISNAGDNDKRYIAMENMKKYLVDEKSNLVKLLTPSIQNEKIGYIASYAKGMRENGQYTHAAIWSLIAYSNLDMNEEMMDIYKKINPIEHTKTKAEIEKYKVEPFVVAADIYGEGNLIGRGGWTWYTGSSAWLYETQIKYILGINIYHGKMKIKPCVPEEWNNFKVTLKWKNATYEIKYMKSKENKKTNIEDEGIILEESGKFEVLVRF